MGIFYFIFILWLSNQEVPAFDFGGLEEAIVLQGYKVDNIIDDAKLRKPSLPLFYCTMCNGLNA